MKNFNHLCIVIALAAISCTDSLSLQQDNRSGLDKRSYILSTEATKASLGSDLATTWEVGDAFSVYDPIAGTGRKFTVTEVGGGKATIVGTISKGVSTFSAVYPYEVASAWVSADSCTVAVPMDQSIDKGSRCDSRALTCGAFNADPEGTIQMNNLYSLVRFDIGREDVSQVKIQLTAQDGGSSEDYTVTPASGLFATGSYCALVKPGDYAGGVKVTGSTEFDVDYILSSAKTMSISKGQSVNFGEVTEGTRYIHYKTTKSGSVSNALTLIKRTRYYDLIKYEYPNYSTTLIDAVLAAKMSDYLTTTEQNKSAYTYNFTYTSAGMDGNPLTLSAKLYIPAKAVDSGLEMEGLMLGSRAMITRNSDCPTNREQAEGIAAWKDYAVVMPDFYGFGVDADHPQAIMNEALIGRNNADAILAAKQIVADMGLTCKDQFLNLGYSNGGIAAVATQKYVIDHPDYGIVFVKSFAGGGAYDYNLCYDAYVADPDTYSTAGRFFIIGIISINESECLNLSYANVFQEPLLSNYEEWVLSKQYDIQEIMEKVGSDGTLPDIVTEGIINQSNAEAKKLQNAMSLHALTGGIKLPDATEFFLMHSTADDYIPFANYEALEPTLSGGTIHRYADDYGGHIEAFLEFLELVSDNI